MRQSHKTILLWVGLFAMFSLIWMVVASSRSDVKEVGFSAFVRAIGSGDMAHSEVEIRNDRDFTWTAADGGRSHTTGVWTDTLSEQLLAHNVEFKFVNDDGGALWQGVLASSLPIVLVMLLMFFVIRQLQAGGGKAMSFGKSKARLVSEGAPKVTFKDVAGATEAKTELEEIIDFLKDPKKFTRLGGRIPKGVLLMGPPGTGKTLLARAIAGEAGVPFFSISGSDFVEMFVGVGASRVRDLFEQSKRHAPCIIFIDEIDAVGRHRGAGMGGGHDEREQTLNQLLVEMDGFESNEGVILIAATNRPDVLDKALLRPGRFDRRVVVPLPDMTGRGEILTVHTRKVPLTDDVDLDVLARGTPGFSGADLANLVNEAALIAARESLGKVNQHDFEHAKDKVMMGAERKSMVLSEKDKRITAYHEAGHALIAKLVPGTDPVHKVTIIPRGHALGLTQTLPAEDRYTQSRSVALDQIAMLFGGRLAEELEFNEMTSGAGNDIEVASDLARRMVCEWGMSEKLGPMTFGKKDEQMFMGRDLGQAPQMSQQTAQDIDSEVREIIMTQYHRARHLMSNHREALVRVAEALIVYETLEGYEVDLLIDGKSVTRAPPTVRMTTREEVERRFRAKQDEAARQREEKRQLLAPLAGEVKV